jgi:ribonuclease T2
MLGYRYLLTLFVVLGILSGPAAATIPLDGYFIANQSCPALSSIRKNKNPGNVQLEADKAYVVVGKNKADASHYYLKIKGADPVLRWVTVGCGILLTDCQKNEPAAVTEPVVTPTTPETPAPAPTPVAAAAYVLAASWQPAFCQTHQYKPECEEQTSDRYDATNFTLHGLWPQPRGNDYCGVSNADRRLDSNKAWSQLPALALSPETRADLAVVMPGMASYLHRHEWTKHGTCYGAPAENYFRHSLALMDQLNSSVVRDLFADNIGQRLTATQIRASFDQAFGAGTGKKIKVKCSGGLVTELQLQLKGSATDGISLGDMLSAANDTNVDCNGGTVDAVGF